MVDVLHLGALLSAGVGLPCTVSARRADALRWVPAAIMLLAMADLCFDSGLLAPIGWVAVMIVTAVWLAVRVRLAPAADEVDHARAAWLHHACALMVMAGLTAVMGAPAPGSSAGHHGGDDGVLAGLAVIASLAFIGYTAWLVRRLRRRRQRAVRSSIEAGSMVAMVAAMAIAVVL